MKIIKGIMIDNQLPVGYDAVLINTGTIFHSELVAPIVQYNGHEYQPLYEPHAYIPKRDWQPLSNAEINRLKARPNKNTYNTIYLGEVSESLRNQLQELDLSECKSRPEVLEKFSANPQRVKLLSEEINRFLLPFSDSKPFHFHCIGVNMPNLELVACNTTMMHPNFKEHEKRYLGIHNDGTQFMTLHTAHKFGNRFTINLGKEARAFLFVNISMIQAVNMLKTKIDIKAHALSIYNIPRLFFKYFPDYPVIKIIQQPYQYYIASTDNCFHDGSTLGNQNLDITMVYFGAFQP